MFYLFIIIIIKLNKYIKWNTYIDMLLATKSLANQLP